MKFIEDDTLKGLSEHLFGASGAMYSIATHLMTLETLFSHPAEFAKRHHESPEVESFKQNPSRESMVAYTASQTLSHSEIVPKEEQGASIWDVLTQRSSTREAQQTGTFWNAVQENVDDDEPEYDYEDDEQEETIAAPTRRGPRRNVLDDEDEEYDEEQEPFNTPKSSAEHALFIRSWALPWAGNALPEPKRQDPGSRKRPSSRTKVWASFGLSTDQLGTSPPNAAPPAKKRASTGHARGRGTRGKRGQPTARHIYFE